MGADMLPFALGRDLSGVIEAIGGDPFGDWQVGDRVCALIGRDRGAQGELVIVKLSELVSVPDDLGMLVAAAIPLAAMTAWQGLFDRGGLEAGQSILIHGGAGGVGHFAVQFARRRGATVYATASGRDRQFVRSLGADRVIDYETERFEELVGDLDVVFDTQGGETQARSFGVLREGGVLVSTLDVDEAAAAAAGVRVAPRWHVDPDAAELREVVDLVATGAVEVTIRKAFPLGEVVAAQQFARTARTRGKILLQAPV